MSSTSTPFPESSFAYLAKSEKSHWWFRARNKIILWALAYKCHAIRNMLEDGCGTGYVTSGISETFPELELEASEYFQDGLVFARQRVPQCQFRQLDATAMEDENTYDCVGSFDVLEHIDDDELVLANFHRALRPRGYLMLTVPQHPWMWSAADNHAHHVRRYTCSELRKKVLCAGFRIVYCTSFISLLLPLMVLQRLSSRDQAYNPDSEFKISPVLNTMLYQVMQLEFTLLRLGLRFPVGGSLLLLARKP